MKTYSHISKQTDQTFTENNHIYFKWQWLELLLQKKFVLKIVIIPDSVKNVYILWPSILFLNVEQYLLKMDFLLNF